jgi:hypothetical protein
MGWHWCIVARHWVTQHPWLSALSLTGAITVISAIGGLVKWPFEFKKLWREHVEEKRRLRNEELDRQVLELVRENFGRIKEGGDWHGTLVLTDKWKITAAMALGVTTDDVRDSVRRLSDAHRLPWQS